MGTARLTVSRSILRDVKNGADGDSLAILRHRHCDMSGASSVFQLDAFFIAATGPPRLGEGEPLIRWGKVPLFHDECLAYYSE